MAHKKSSGKLVIYAILLVLLFFGLINIFVDGAGRWFFGLELLGLLFLLLLTLISFVNYKSAWGERTLFFLFLFYIVNLVLVWLYNGSVYLILLFLAIAGFLMAVPKKRMSAPVASKPTSEEPHSVVFDEPPQEKAKSVKAKSVKAKSVTVSPTKSSSKKKSSTNYSPGKYIASSRSNIYHEPKCDWAKKISKERRVWFKGKEEAWEKGYRAHGCVE